MPKPALGKVAVGDELIVIERQNIGSRQTVVAVVKVGRVWIDVVPTDRPTGLVRRMRLDTQTDGGDIGYPTRFVTPEQHAWEQRIADARNLLADAGLELRSASAWRDEDRLFALAAFVAAYDADHPTTPAA